MLDGKRYFAEFPHENPGFSVPLYSPKLVALLRALEKALRPHIACALKDGGEVDGRLGRRC
jgi:hypothetical protein